jgi:hypothetical protein
LALFLREAEKAIPLGKWHYVRVGQPSPDGDDFVVIAAPEYETWRKRWRDHRHDQDVALMQEVRASAALADELAFWRYQAVFGRACLLAPHAMSNPFMEDSSVWKEATRQLDEARTLENQERVVHAEAPRDPGAT